MWRRSAAVKDRALPPPGSYGEDQTGVVLAGAFYILCRGRPAAPAIDNDVRAMQSLIILVDSVIGLYVWLLIASVVISWLVAFKVVNTSNRFVYQVGDFLYRITEPALRPIRRFVPSIGGIDISPVLLILLLFFVRNLLKELFYGIR